MDIRLVGPGDAALLTRVANGVFDHDREPDLTNEFLHDGRHHLVVAIDDGIIVGFVSGVHYIHPDKPAELWINEVGVAPSHQRRGIGRHMLRTMFQVGVQLGCHQAWVLTNRSNMSAMRLYGSLEGIEDPEDTVMFTFKLCEVEVDAAARRSAP